MICLPSFSRGLMLDECSNVKISIQKGDNVEIEIMLQSFSIELSLDLCNSKLNRS